ncbi:ABC transporter permease [Acidihalobacter ferrooxydans]|uniref:ABC transmembrane type-1 domain-containing protein n=1 Tax=Acidihalobacter ferrooxydans TaxID=1765967 RepID=A0A1P8UEJ0_9GAMM|nr:ABC transporter permease [Acidihalobacter ferrooxydans]APZ42174.1 hypothetical protein BW247_02925 [Acidihalobacter ferrooxydans]
MKRHSQIYSPILFGIAMIIVWQICITAFDVKSYVFPSPMGLLLSIERHHQILLAALWVTSQEALAGLGLAVAVGLAVAIVTAHFQFINKMIMPYLVIVQTTPIVAIAPLFVLWFGEGMLSRIVSSFAVTLIPMTITMTQAFQVEDGGRHDIYRVFKYGPVRRFLMITFPLAVPGILSSLQFGVALAVVGAIVGELVTADSGLGYVIIQASYEVDTPLLFAAISFAALIGIVLYLLITSLAQMIHLDRYYISER